MFYTNLPSSTEPPDYLLALPEVKKRIGVRADSTIYELMAKGFPKPVKLSRRMVRWPASAVDAWLAARISEAAK